MGDGQGAGRQFLPRRGVVQLFGGQECSLLAETGLRVGAVGARIPAKFAWSADPQECQHRRFFDVPQVEEDGADEDYGPERLVVARPRA